MRFLICIAGLPRSVVNSVREKSPAVFTEAKDNLPILREISTPYAYRNGMSDFYLTEIAARLEQIPPGQEVGIGLAYAKLGGASESFLQNFCPFAVTVPFDPFYPDAQEKHQRRAELKLFEERLIEVVRRVRDRIRLMRDVLSGQNFSPLTLPVRNFRSDVLDLNIKTIFQQLGTSAAARKLVEQHRDDILARHPLRKLADGSHRPYFEDDRQLRFKSPGSDNHGNARVVGDGHRFECLINGRARLGAPIKAGFHYDCCYERGRLDAFYANCHGANVGPSKNTYVNISPSDAVR